MKNGNFWTKIFKFFEILDQNWQFSQKKARFEAKPTPFEIKLCPKSKLFEIFAHKNFFRKNFVIQIIQKQC